MWQCSKCRKSIEDNFDSCWSCGTSRDGVEDPGFRPEEGANDEPLAEAEMCLTGVQKPSELTASSTTTDAPSDPGWREAGLAALGLRLLGVYFTALGLIRAAEEATRFFLARREPGQDLVPPTQWPYLIFVAAELAVGFYLLVDGRWVYEKVLRPIAANPINDTPEDRGETEHRL